MGLPAFASETDLEARMGPLPDLTRALAALDDASALIRSEAYPQSWIDEETGELVEFPGILTTICCAAARRSLENPQGMASVQTGPFGASYANASPDVYLTKSEKRQGRQAAGKVSSSFAVDTVSTTGAIVHADVCSVYFGATYCSCGAILTQGWPLYETGW